MVELIAEIGENHCGDMARAEQLIIDAAEVGADAVKFQCYDEACIREDDPERDWFLKVALSRKDVIKLKEVAANEEIKFFASPFSRERADMLFNIGIREVKIASCMMNNLEFLKHVASLQWERVYLSTGASTLDNTRRVVNLFENAPFQNKPMLVIMHCISLYPPKDSQMDMKTISLLKREFGKKHKIGYSDHTIGEKACIVAVSLGAEVIEKHFTFNVKHDEGTDHILSASKSELARIRIMAGTIQELLGRERTTPIVSEIEVDDEDEQLIWTVQELLERRFIA